MAAITAGFDPAQPWRVNFFRCEGTRPTPLLRSLAADRHAEPNFHVPEKFGTLRFVE